MSLVYYDLHVSEFRFGLVMFCWQVNRNPVRLYWRVRVLNVCSGHVLSFALTWSGEALHTLYDRASMASSSSACCVVMLFFSFLLLESKGHVFELPRVVQICRSDFSLVRHIVCLRLYFVNLTIKRVSPAAMCADVQMALRFDSNGLFWFYLFFLTKIGFGYNSAV